MAANRTGNREPARGSTEPFEPDGPAEPYTPNRSGNRAVRTEQPVEPYRANRTVRTVQTARRTVPYEPSRGGTPHEPQGAPQRRRGRSTKTPGALHKGVDVTNADADADDDEGEAVVFPIRSCLHGANVLWLHLCSCIASCWQMVCSASIAQHPTGWRLSTSRRCPEAHSRAKR